MFVLVFFGFVAVCGTAFVQLGARARRSRWLAAVPVGALATAILVVNNLRDRETDASRQAHAGGAPGAAGGRAEYAVLLAAAYAVPVAASNT